MESTAHPLTQHNSAQFGNGHVSKLAERCGLTFRNVMALSCPTRCRCIRKRELTGTLRSATPLQTVCGSLRFGKRRPFSKSADSRGRLLWRRCLVPLTNLGLPLNVLPRSFPCERRPYGQGQDRGGSAPAPPQPLKRLAKLLSRLSAVLGRGSCPVPPGGITLLSFYASLNPKSSAVSSSKS